MESIELQDLSKSYGRATALEAVTLTFEPGWHLLVGPNGAGKTTLFRLLLGLTRPDAGHLSIPDVTVGCSFQTPRVYEGLTVRENLEVFGGIAGAESAWLETLLDRCGLRRVAHRRATELSGGFRRRLDVALAFVDRPDVVVLDEPLADVDDEFADQLVEFFASYDAPDRLFLIASHQLDRFAPRSDTATVLVDGRVQWHGDPATLPDERVQTLYRGIAAPGDGGTRPTR